MILRKVLYRLFESDAWHLDHEAAPTHHVIDREIRLEFDDGPTLFVSWTSKPRQYSIGYSHRPFFEGACQERDMSEAAPWDQIAGLEVTLGFLDPEHQVLSISAEDGERAVYCASLEDQNWGMDVVRVSSRRPDGPPRLP